MESSNLDCSDDYNGLWGFEEYNGIRYGTCFKFNSYFTQYSKKVCTQIALNVNCNQGYIGSGTYSFGGSVSWIYDGFSAGVTWGDQPSRGVILTTFKSYTLSDVSTRPSFRIELPIYKKGYSGKYGSIAPRSIFEQLSVGFNLGWDVNSNDYPAYPSRGLYHIEPGFLSADLVFEDWNPTLTARFPLSSAYVSPSIANNFSVSFDAFNSIDYPTVQTITYEIKDTATGTVVDHTASVSINLRDRSYVEWTVPANTLASGKDYQWRAKLTTDDGETGYSNWADFTTRDATPGIPTIIYPQSKYLIGSDAITLQWQHNVTTDSAQHAFDLQYKQAGSWTDIAVHTYSAAQSYILAANFFAAGTMYWRVRTYNTDDVVGDWGTSSANVVQAKPVTPILYGITGAPRITAYWQSTGQQAYQFTVSQSATTIWDSGAVYGVARTCEIDRYLDDGSYTVCLMIQNGLGIWSDCALQSVNISNNAQPGDDVLSATPVSGGIRLDISLPEPTGADYVGEVYVGEPYVAHQPYNASGTRYILRDGEPIAKIAGTSYTDYTVSGNHEYKVKIVSSDGNYHDTNSVIASPLISYACIAEFSSPESVLVLKFNEGSAPKLENSLSKVISTHYFAGRTLPCHDVTEHHDSTWSFTYTLLNLTDYDTLYQLFLAGKTVIFRDYRGYKAVGTLASIKKSPSKDAINITFTVEETDASEVIDYD